MFTRGKKCKQSFVLTAVYCLYLQLVCVSWRMKKNTCGCLVLVSALQLPFCLSVESILSPNRFSMIVKSLINQLIGQHAWKGQLSLTVTSSREALWQMSCLCGLSDWLAVSGAFSPSLSPILCAIVCFLYFNTFLFFIPSRSSFFINRLILPPSLPLFLWLCVL